MELLIIIKITSIFVLSEVNLFSFLFKSMIIICCNSDLTLISTNYRSRYLCTYHT